ncbi:HAMP domain-containing histidine kinase [Streptomyces sp. NA04227]|uniref:sensor histidine kinase n=1 Tax=Streptomyces sp. NA04227 TaxID=2742136 RepID=UPI0015900C7A|nr:HAMP domain-containing sensor histidine kinase [Streptomyces sp. NA04227]QKW06526.1 HAMP domain-containing histidine kinase [Streptomyces sp. NA04227]
MRVRVPRRRRSRPLTPTARVRRLRRRITVLFALTSAVGVVAMGAFAVRSDAQRWRAQLDQTMNADTSWDLGLLEIDENGGLDTRVLVDTVDTDCPPLTILTARHSGGKLRLNVEHAPEKPCLPLRSSVVRDVAAAAVREDGEVAFDRRTPGGDPVRVFALPYYPAETDENTRPEGALVTWSDASEQRADHRRLAWLVTGACAVLVAMSAVVGHLLSGRAIRPALAALGQQEAFLADAAHDLRTPTASLRMLAETGLRGETDPSDVLRRTLRLSESMGGLVDGLLTRARLMSGTATLAREPLRLDQLVESVVADTPAEGHRVAVEAEPSVVFADPDLVRRAVANLLGNALTHGHAPGEAADVRITVSASGIVTVDDAGPGLPPQVAGALFERFRSGSGSTGLGLSIASWVAHAHGGTLTAGPGARGGASFVLRLPPARENDKSRG